MQLVTDHAPDFQLVGVEKIGREVFEREISFLGRGVVAIETVFLEKGSDVFLKSDGGPRSQRQENDTKKTEDDWSHQKIGWLSEYEARLSEISSGEKSSSSAMTSFAPSAWKTRGPFKSLLRTTLSTIRTADCILVFHKGGILESGTNPEFLALREHCPSPYTRQFGKEKVDFRDPG